MEFIYRENQLSLMLPVDSRGDLWQGTLSITLETLEGTERSDLTEGTLLNLLAVFDTI